jgi:hypothetical protein
MFYKPQTRLVLQVLLLVFAVTTPLLVLGGCGKPPPPKATVAPEAGGVEDTLNTAVKFLRLANEPAQYREALNLVNDTFKPDVKVINDLTDKKALQEQFNLDDEALAYLEATTFRPADAHYLESCYLFRDAAKTLEVGGLSPKQQVLHALDWVLRHVLFHEQADADLPPAYVVKEGHGNVRDRGIVALELLRQMSLDGCLVATDAKDAAESVLLGVLLDDKGKTQLGLFDLRVGALVVDAKGSPASLAELAKSPHLLKSLHLAPEAAGKLKLRLATPLAALAPRMKYLETRVNEHHRIAFHQNAGKLKEDLEAAAGALVAPWKDTEHAGAPAHLLHRFLPAKEGGRDKDGRRFLEAQQRAFPLDEIRQRLIDTKVFVGLAPEAPPDFFKKAQELFVTFYQQPRDMLLHGKVEDVLTRISRVQTAFDEVDLAVKGEAFETRLDAWRQKVNDAYTARARKEKDGERRVNAIWEGDRELQALFDLTGGKTVGAKEKDKDKPAEKGVFGWVLLDACRQPVGEKVNFLVANSLQDSAERKDAQAGVRKAHKGKAAVDAWDTAREQWKFYCDRHLVGPNDLKDRLPHVFSAPNAGFALARLERLFLDLHHGAAARLLWCQAEFLSDQEDRALALREKLRGDLQDMLADRELIGAVDRLRALFPKDIPPHVELRFDLLRRDWAPGGPWETWLAMLDAEPFAPK